MDWTGFAVVTGLTILVSALVVVASRRMRRRPTTAVGGGVRMPVVIAVMGWLLAVPGAIIALIAFLPDDDGDPVPMRIASVGVVVVGIGLVALHRNWRLAVLDDRVYQRTALGRVRCVVYDDIVSSRLVSMRGSPVLEVRSGDGDRIAVNPAAFDLGPLLRAIAARGFRGHAGDRW